MVFPHLKSIQLGIKTFGFYTKLKRAYNVNYLSSIVLPGEAASAFWAL